MDKFIAPQSAIALWGHFYGVDVWRSMAYFLGTLEAVTVLASSHLLVDPWGDPLNHLFVASIPVFGATLALFLLRHWDRGMWPRKAGG